MIHLVTHANRHRYAEELAEMHRGRKRHFVDERGWRLKVDGDQERDRYDDARTMYLLKLDDDGEVGMSVRLRPAEDACMLADDFPEFLVEPPQGLKRPGVIEFSRYYAGPHYRAADGMQRRAELRVAVLEAALSRGGTRVVGLTDTYLYAQTAVQSGWRVRPLGLPLSYIHGEAIAFEVAVDEEAVTSLREQFDVQGPVVLELDNATAPKLPPRDVEMVLHALQGGGAQRGRVLSAILKRLVEISETHDEDTVMATLERIEQLAKGTPLSS